MRVHGTRVQGRDSGIQVRGTEALGIKAHGTGMSETAVILELCTNTECSAFSHSCRFWAGGLAGALLKENALEAIGVCSPLPRLPRSYTYVRKVRRIFGIARISP